MNNAGLPAMPTKIMVKVTQTMSRTEPSQGLTKREHFAAMAMSAIVPSAEHRGAGLIHPYTVDGMAGVAVNMADALLEALEAESWRQVFL